MCRPQGLTTLAELFGKVCEFNRALSLIDEAFAIVRDTGEIYYAPEAHRVKAELLFKLGGRPAQVEASFTEAVTAARRQHSRLFELRSAVGLARLWRDQGREAEAANVLSSIYKTFVEGFGHVDLIEARAVLDTLKPCIEPEPHRSEN